MAVSADKVVVELEAKLDAYNDNVKKAEKQFTDSMRAIGHEAKRVEGQTTESFGAAASATQQLNAHVEAFHAAMAKAAPATGQMNSHVEAFYEHVARAGQGTEQLNAHVDAFQAHMASAGQATGQFNSHVEAYHAHMAAGGRATGAASGAVRGLAGAFVRILGPIGLVTAALTLVSAGIDYLVKKWKEAEVVGAKLVARTAALNAELEKAAPFLSNNANALGLVNEGQANFNAWLDKNNQKLGDYAERLKTATVNQYLLAAAEAYATREELRREQNKRVGMAQLPGPIGLFGKFRLGSQTSRDNLAAQAVAEENLRIARERATQAFNAPLSAFTPEPAKGRKGPAADDDKSPGQHEQDVRRQRKLGEKLGAAFAEGYARFLDDKEVRQRALEEAFGRGFGAFKDQQRNMLEAAEAKAEAQDAKDELIAEQRKELYDATYEPVRDAMQALADGDIVEYFANSLKRAILDNVAEGLTNALLGAQGGGGIGGALASLFIPGRASGGPVAAGRPYMVGERGAELFVPAQAGRIVPNQALAGARGGGVTVLQTVQASFRGAVVTERLIADFNTLMEVKAREAEASAVSRALKAAPGFLDTYQRQRR